MTHSWSRVGRAAGYLSGAALLLGTILYLLDATSALGSNIYATRPGLTPIQNDANYRAAQSAQWNRII